MKSIQAMGRALPTFNLRLAVVLFLAVAALALVACGDDDDDGGDTGTSPTSPTSAAGGNGASTEDTDLSGPVEIDGSSTVFPITEAVAEEFGIENKDVRVTVGISGTGGGFSRFCAGETDISDASRPIKTGADSEAATCEAAGIEYIEIPVAYDGLSVVVHPDNDWATCLTVEELNLMWAPEAEGTISNWNQIRADFPDAPLTLYGPGTDSGTFDYFTEVINGESQASRADFTASEDDNILVQGVAGDQNALGYFGLAYLEENQDKIKGVEVDGGGGCVGPTTATVEEGTYAPLSRPLFIYVNTASLDKPQVKAFVEYYLENVPVLAADVGYVKFPDNFYTAITERWEAGETGSIFSGASGSVGEILGVN
jgi:phosphate transport system substrate-binding protein